VLRDFHQRSKEPKKAAVWAANAEKLAENIRRAFWNPTTGFRVSTQDHSDHGFYPDEIAQLFPLLAKFSVPGVSNSTRYTQMDEEKPRGLVAPRRVGFSMGLIALIAQNADDRKTVLCWCARAGPFRHGKHWNVLGRSTLSRIRGAI